MSFLDERAAFEAELEEWFGQYPWPGDALEAQLHAHSARHPEWSPCRRKAYGYGRLAEACPVRVFRHSPFYFELCTGAQRRDLGTGGVGGWLKREPDNAALCRGSAEWWSLPGQLCLSVGWPMYDDNHHTAGYDAVLRLGLRGLAAAAEARLRTADTAAERDFLEAAIAGQRALMRIAERMGEQAAQMAREEPDARIRQRLALLAATAARVPAKPPTTFYEALAAVLFIFRVLQYLEGNGLSVLGHLDRMLIPYLRQDLASGVLDLEGARDLLRHFLAVVDTRFGMRQAQPHHVGTNTAIALGGCDREGQPVANELTRLVLEAHRELRLVDPKVNLRLSPQHPPELVAMAASFLAAGGNSLAIFNDPVIIAANAAAGKDLRDCRLYVGGGCQENVLENCEVNSRATIYLNLAAVFLMGLFPGRYRAFCAREGIAVRTFEEGADFESLYQAFLANLDAVLEAHVRERNRTEAQAWRYNPCPAHSATMDDCLARARDMFDRGIRYSAGSISLAGIGTLIDSLFAVRQVVFDERQCTLEQLRQWLDADFSGAEPFRRLLAGRVAKFGQEDAAIGAFSSRVFADLARVSTGRPNARGGRYEASLFSFRTFAHLGAGTGATPDGRRAGDHLSPGMGPSLLALGPQASVGSVLAALEPLDMTQYPVVAVLDLKLPQVAPAQAAAVLGAVIGRFLELRSSVLQINCVDQSVLLAARAHPELHPDLVVRVSGYSSYFHVLAPEIQDEIIARTVAA